MPGGIQGREEESTFEGVASRTRERSSHKARRESNLFRETITIGTEGEVPLTKTGLEALRGRGEETEIYDKILTIVE